jgi:hypothetical protein
VIVLINDENPDHLIRQIEGRRTNLRNSLNRGMVSQTFTRSMGENSSPRLSFRIGQLRRPHVSANFSVLSVESMVQFRNAS